MTAFVLFSRHVLPCCCRRINFGCGGKRNLRRLLGRRSQVGISAIAGCQLFVVDREDLAHLDLDAVDQASLSLLVRDLDVKGAGLHPGNGEPFVGIDNAVLVVLGLVGTPIRGADGSQIELGEIRPCVRFQKRVGRPWARAIEDVTVSARTMKASLCMAYSDYFEVRSIVTAMR